MKTIFFSAILALLLMNQKWASAQNIMMPEMYNAVSVNQKIPIFTDNFTDNRNHWYLGIKENVWFENLQDSTLIFQSFENVPKEDFKEVIINQQGNFEIELKIRLDKGIQNKFNGLQWGKSASEGKQFDFFFNGQGQYTIDKFTGQFTDFVPVTSSKLVNNYTYNILTVRKVDNQYYFFINKELVHKMPFEPFFGNGIGFQVAEISSVQIDYLHVWQLPGSTTGQLAEVALQNLIVSAPDGKVAPGQTITASFMLSNLASTDANNVKLRYQFPAEVLLLESKTDFVIPAGKEQQVDLVFYLNKSFTSQHINIPITVEGATLSATGLLGIDIALNQEVERNNTTEPDMLALTRGSNDPLKGLGASKAMAEVAVGRYFALIIGIDTYSGDWKPLKNAVNDAKAVEQQLRNNYEFHTIRTLYNEQATRTGILTEYEWLMANVRENDNLLIFYSGHGDYNESLQRGYWVPVDAKNSSVSALIANTDIQSFLSGIKSKHTFLIADACFSGDIFRGKTLTIPYENSFKYYNQIYSKPSRTALTSGGIEPVMDGGKEGHSVFSYYLLKSLKSNQNQFFDGSQLYNDLKVAVINNSNQTPGFSPIVNTGDEGGQFIFIKKQGQ